MPGNSLFELERRLDNSVDLVDEPSLGVSLHLGLQSNPDKEAKVRKQAEQAGIPPEVVRGNAVAAREAEVQGLIAGMDDHPLTRNLMANPDNAAIAHDSTESLVKIEKEGGFFSRIGKSILGFGKDIGESIESVGEKIGEVGETIGESILEFGGGVEDVVGKVGDAFKQGRLTHQLGYEGFDLKNSTAGPEQAAIKGRIKGIKTEMDNLGVSNDGFIGFLTSASEILGQQFNAFSQPEASQRIAIGGVFGAGAGLAGGPLAPVTSAVGAGVGIASGAISHRLTDAFVVESGHAYLDLIEKGIDKDTAATVAVGVGVVNAALELVGTAAVVIPIAKATKAIAKRAAKEVLKKEETIKAARNFAIGYGTAVGGETATEIMQEGILMAGEEIARQFTDTEQEISPITFEEAVSRMEEVAVKTFKGMAVLALPGSSANYITDRSQAKKAIERDKVVETLVEAVEESPVTERSPEVIAEHVQDAMDIEAVDMPVEAFDEMILDLGVTPETVLTTDTLVRMHEEAKQIGGDVRIPAGALVKNIMVGPTKEVFDKYRQHIRWNPGDMTAAEAIEFEASGIEQELATNVSEAIETIDEAEASLAQRLVNKVSDTVKQVLPGKQQEQKEVSRDTQEVGPVKTDLNPELKLAEDSLGLQALFRTADEAGMTEKKYTTYLATVQRAATKSNNRKDISKAKREARQVTKDIKTEQAVITKEVEEVVRQEPVYAAIHGTEDLILDYQSINELLSKGKLTDLEKYSQSLPDSQGVTDYPAINKLLSKSKQSLSDSQGVIDYPAINKLLDKGKLAKLEKRFQSLPDSQKVTDYPAINKLLSKSKQSLPDSQEVADYQAINELISKGKLADLEKYLQSLPDSPGVTDYPAINKLLDKGKLAKLEKHLQSLPDSQKVTDYPAINKLLSKSKQSLPDSQKVTDYPAINKLLDKGKLADLEKHLQSLPDSPGVTDYPAINKLLGKSKQSLPDSREVTDAKDITDMRGQLRQQGVRVSKVGEEGVHIDEYADLYGFENGTVMIDTMLTIKKEKQEVTERAEQEVRVRNPELFSKQAEIQENIVSLMHDDTQRVIAAEVDALTEDRKGGKVKPALVREVARRALDQHIIRDISVSKYLANARKHGRAAGKSLRAADREAARQAKVNQLLNMEFAKEAEAKRQIVQKGHKYLSQFSPKQKISTLGPGYLEAIRDVIGQFSLSPDLSPSKREKLEAFVNKAQEDGANFEFPKRLLDDEKRNYKDFTIHDFELVIQKTKEIHKAGLKAEQDRAEGRRTKTAIRVDAVTQALASKPPVEQTLEVRGTEQSVNRAFEEAKLLLLNADSILRDIDNFKNLGPVYQAIKGPIDLSVTNGYGAETNVGLVVREKQIAENLLSLFKVFSKEEMNTLSRATFKVPGFTTPLSRNAQLSLLLNTGNEQNRQALYDSGQVTEEQVNNLIESASKRDMDFIQSVWDYLDSFWPEINEGTQRRRGFVPEKVQATPINTSHGTYAGGYYPLRYDNNKGVNDPTSESVEEAISQARYGRAIASHTRHDHTEQRLGSQGRPVLLDLFVVNSHLDQVAYDLELGDAINETYSVVHHPSTKKAFRDKGQVATWKALDLWLGDVVTGEMHSGGVVEKGLRWLRAGFTVSKLGWNVGVAAIQPLGIIQTSVHLGHKNTLDGLKQMLKMPLYGKDNVFHFVNEQSQVMAQRDETFHKDIADASQLVSDSWLRRVAPEGSVEFVNDSLFYGIKKVQRFVDTWTWVAAKKAGLQEFNNDEALSTQFADRTVIRSQASGNFQERTAFERGSISSKTRQTELVRTFTALISYFMAKSNVTYERTKKTNFRKPGQVVSWATDMMLLYVVEAALVGLIRGQWPDGEEEDDYGAAVSKYIAGEGLNTLFAGVPLIREFSSEAGGFRGGGVFSSVIEDFGKLTEQAGQGEIDKALLTSANNLGGILFKYPASQINKTGKAIALSAEGEDVGWVEFIMGPKWNKYN